MNTNNLTPNVIIAGVTKAGTTSLFTYLKEHPEICGSTVKEISHFVNIRFKEPSKPLSNYNQYYEHWHNEPFKLESSPAYFLGGEELAKAIDSELPDTKVIIVLRDPVSRCKSHFNFNKNMLRMPKEMTLQQYIDKCQATPYEKFRERNHYVYYGLASGIYSNYIDGWIDTFGDNLHICFFDDLMSDPQGFTQSICQWLGIDKTFFSGYDFVIENKSRDFNNPKLQQAALKINKYFEPFLRKNIAVKRVVRSFYYAVNGSNSKASRARVDDDKDTKALQAYYAPYNQLLKKQLLDAGVSKLPKWLGDAENE